MSQHVALLVEEKFKGMLVFGDVHGDFRSFSAAYEFARTHDLFFMSLGDLVDRDRMPYEVVEAMHTAMVAGHAGFVVGNHDDKHRRGAKGNKVSFSRDARQTLADVGAHRMDNFARMYVSVVEDPVLSGYFHKFGDITLVHAAAHPCLWESPAKIGKSEQSRFMVGETNGEVLEDGYPVRLYNWTDCVPMGKTVIVGHDRMPITGVPMTAPMTVSNSSGGKVVFLDTGCGKGGFLSGAVVLHDKNGFHVDRYVEFK